MQSDVGRAGQDATGIAAESGPLVRVAFSPGRTLWRVGPAWAVLVGAAAAGWLPADTGALLRLAAAVILGDLVWGSLRPLLPPAPVATPTSTSRTACVSLPYAQPAAPLSRLLRALGAGMGVPADRSWQPVAFGATLAVGLSWLLGPAALALTLVAMLVTAWAWLWASQRGAVPALALALLDVVLPGLLGVSLAGGWPPVDRSAFLAPALLAGFTLLQWGLYLVAARAGAWQAWAGQLAVLLALVLLQRPAACALVAALFAPAAWWLARNPEQAAARGQSWWWTAFLVAFLAPG